MKEPVVADTSCLISLERIDHLHVLPELFEPIFAPPAVQREFGLSFQSLKINNPVNRLLVAQDDRG